MKGPRRYFIVNLRLDELATIEEALSGFSLTEDTRKEEMERWSRLLGKIKTIRKRLEDRQAKESIAHKVSPK